MELPEEYTNLTIIYKRSYLYLTFHILKVHFTIWAISPIETKGCFCMYVTYYNRWKKIL